MSLAIAHNWHRNKVHDVAVSPDGRYFASSSGDKRIIVGSFETYDVEFELEN